MGDRTAKAQPGRAWPDGLADRLLSLVVDLTCVAGFDGKFRELSDGWQDLLGYSSQELLDRPFLELIHPEDFDSTSEVLEELRSGRAVREFSNRFVAKDGTLRWLRWAAVSEPERDEYCAVAQNTTANHRAEVDIDESQQRYLDLIESSHDIVQSILPDGHFEFVNQAWHRILGYDETELPTLTLFDIVDAGGHEHCNIIIGQLMSGAAFKQIEVTFVTKDGREIPVEGNATGRFRDGQYVATHSFFHDITERKKAEALSASYQKQLEKEVAERTSALVQSEKLATLGRLSAGMAHELNNPAAAAQRGASRLRESITGTQAGLLRLDNLKLGRAAVSDLAKLLRKSEVRASEPDYLDPLTRADRESDTEDWLDQRGVEDPWVLAGPLVSQDLAVDDLADMGSSFSAEQLPVVLQVLSQSHTAFVLLEQISHGTQRVSEIVTALKAYSYMDRAPVDHVDIHDGLNNTLIMLQGKLKGGVEVQRNYGPDVPTIETHGSELNQVWTNLIDNAIDAMDGEGHITIRTRKSDDRVVVEVEDDGSGIVPEKLDNVFEPFFTTKLPGQGTGLGLNIVYNIVRNQGGDIEVESAPGNTVFRVWIPIKQRTASETNDPETDSAV